MHARWSLQGLTGPPTHAFSKQWSGPVQKRPSSHELSLAVNSQSPVDVLQVSVVQTLLSSQTAWAPA